MKKIIFIFSVVLAVLCLAVVASAKLAPAQQDKSNSIPPGLEDKGPLTKITFIHYKNGDVKPSHLGKPAKDKACYTFLANGAKWKTVENYFINPTNSGLDNSLIEQAINNGVAEWEEYGGPDIFGSGSLDSSAPYDSDHMDNKNVTVFDSYPNPNVIAVTTVWGYFYGPPRTRELVEWDILFNKDFAWGDGGINQTVMDLQNIATHELGHSAGMGDLYNTSCSAETMYGYSSYGETSKRDLNTGDIAGIQTLYK